MSKLSTFEQLSLEPQAQASALKQVHAGNATALQYQVQVFKRMDAALAQTNGLQGRTLACKPGCGLCCHYHVNIAPSEALALAEHVETTFSEAQKAEVRRRLKENTDLAATLGPEKHVYTNIACAFLTEDQKCGVYEVRPAACRRHHSYDLKPCEVTFEDPTAPDQGLPQSREWVEVSEFFILSG
ncbi:YkgJ family cysteine cluster protein, partial [Nostoc sp. CHAB 5834]|nr:YkgJ family cysteine cluster protein [Nostoc sp. CHAB 5834]